MALETIRSEVTGTVFQVLVAPGAQVAADDTLILIESMKMEIPITATCAGTVREVRVSEGDGVADGQDVVIVER